MSNRNSRVHSPRLSTSTVVTQIYDPRSEQAQNDYHLDPDGARPWQAQEGWEFLPPKSPGSASSSNAPNFSRPLGGTKRASRRSALDPQAEEQEPEDQKEGNTFGQKTLINENDTTNNGSDGGSSHNDHLPQKPSSRKGLYSSRSLYSYAGSETSSRARTEASSGSDTPLIPKSKPESNMPPHKTSRRSNSEHRKPLHDPLSAHPTSQASGEPPKPRRPLHNSTRPLSMSTLDGSNREPMLSLSAFDEHDAITALPIMSSSRRLSDSSAAEPPPTIRDGRMLNGRGVSSSNSSGSGGGRVRTHKPATHHTEMSSWPEVRRPAQERPDVPNRRWSASTYDTSELSPEEIAKLKKKGINPALWLEMKNAAGKKSRFGLPPLVGNTFLGA